MEKKYQKEDPYHLGATCLKGIGHQEENLDNWKEKN
jgi:hypothetical protein